MYLPKTSKINLKPHFRTLRTTPSRRKVTKSEERKRERRTKLIVVTTKFCLEWPSVLHVSIRIEDWNSEMEFQIQVVYLEFNFETYN
jgi:hypothetical protein